jgi:hypothetical protein
MRHPHWPAPEFSEVPSLACAERLAWDLRRLVQDPADQAGPLLDLRPLCRLGGFAPKRLSAAAGLEGALVPASNDTFIVAVDAAPTGGWGAVRREQRTALARHRRRFRTAHEIAHGFFYRRAPGVRPRRLLEASDAEERWCDAFGRALLVPSEAVPSCWPSPRAIVELQRVYDVSLQLAVRAVASVHASHFFALLVANGVRPPHLRVQWHSEAADVSPRWWAEDWVQGVLAAPRAHGRAQVDWQGQPRNVTWAALPERRQVLVVG